MAMIRNTLTTIGLLALTTPAPAELCEPHEIASVGGTAWSSVVEGELAYVAFGGAGLVMIDVSTPSEAHVLGRLDTPGHARDLVVRGDIVYLADSALGVAAIDVSDPSSPVLLSSVPTPLGAQGISEAGGFVYAACNTAGVQIIDASDPGALALASAFDTSGVAFSVDAAGDTLYVADFFRGMLAVDVSDPFSPFELGAIQLDDSHDIEIENGIAYVANWSESMDVVDVSDPANPVLLASVDEDDSVGSWAISVEGDRAYAARGYTGTHVYDVSDPANPSLIGVIAETPGSLGVGADADVLCTANAGDGVRIVDLRAEQPEVVSTITMLPLAADVAVRDGYAFVADASNGLQVVDVSDPASPELVGGALAPEYEHPSLGYSVDVAIDGGVAVIAAQASGLHVFDITNPTVPIYVASIETLDRALAVELRGSVAYVADQSGGLVVCDLSVPSEPRIVTSIPAEDYNASDLVLFGDHVYMAGGSSGLLQIFDVSEPSNPIRVGLSDEGGFGLRVQTDGEIAIVQDFFSDVVVFDVSDPTRPEAVSVLGTPSPSRFLELFDRVAYVRQSLTNSGFRAIDLSDPAHPIVLGSARFVAPARFVVVDSLAYVATQTAGISISDLTFCNRVGDFTGDHAVNADDVASLLSVWGQDGAPEPDLNGDGVVGSRDLAILLAQWGS